MAYGMGNIAGMLARSGMQLGQSIGDPISKLGADIGSGITEGMLTRKKEKAVQEAQDIIKKYSNDPTTLNTYYQQAALRGETELAKVFKNAAEAASKSQARDFSENVYKVASQGQAATQASTADPAALSNSIQRLEKLAQEAPDEKTAKAALDRASKLRGKMQAASESAQSNKAAGAINLMKALNAGQFSDRPEAEAKLRDRLKVLSQDPVVSDAIKEYEEGVLEGRQEEASLLIDRQLSVIKASTNPEEIANAQKEIVNIGNQYGIPYSEYIDAGQKRIKAINDDNWQISRRAIAQNEAEKQAIIDQLSNQAVNQENPVAFVDAKLPAKLSSIRDDVIEAVNRKAKDLDAANKLESEGKLSKSDIEFIKRNPSLLETSDGLKKDYQVYTSGKSSPSITRNAAKNLATAVAAERKRQRSIETSGSGAAENASTAINFILGRSQPVQVADNNGNIQTVELPAGTGMFEDPDLYDAVQDIVDGDNKELKSDFETRLKNIYKFNPEASPVESAKKVLDDMKVDYSGQAMTDIRRQDVLEQAANLEETINAYYKDNSIDISKLPAEEQRKQRALAEIAVSRELEKIVEEEKQAKMQRVQDIRSQTPARGQMNVFR